MTKVFSPYEENQWTAPLRPRVMLCSKCKRWRGLNERRHPVCEAFLGGIPKVVLEAEVNHFKENYPGDKGMLGILKEE